jgi:hypothetical protein
MKSLALYAESVNFDQDVPVARHSIVNSILPKLIDQVEVQPGDNKNGMNVGTSKLVFSGYYINTRLYEHMVAAARRQEDEDLYLALTGSELVKGDVADANVGDISKGVAGPALQQTENSGLVNHTFGNSTEKTQNEGESQPDTPIASDNQGDLTKENPTENQINDFKEKIHEAVKEDQNEGTDIVDQDGRDEFHIEENLELTEQGNKDAEVEKPTIETPIEQQTPPAKEAPKKSAPPKKAATKGK